MKPRFPAAVAPPALAALASIACAGSPTYQYQLARSAKAASLTSDLSFVLLADTQYAEPFTDYDVRYTVGDTTVNLPPAVTSNFVTSFYRHAGAHLALPLAMEDVIQKETAARGFGMFGGDLVEFSCKNEAERMFQMLSRERALPFMIAIGNHDALFHGSYDTDAISMSGEGPWDQYSFALWKYVCDRHGGRLTKAEYIRQVLAYYEASWGFNFRTALGLTSSEFPLGVPFSGVVQAATQLPKTAGWELAFSFRLSGDDSPLSHRQSHLYQRFTRRSSESAEPLLTVTVLDTTDYGSRPALCDTASLAVQIGMAGAVSAEQVAWLETLPKASGPQIVLSHNVPLESVYDVASLKPLDPCETTFGLQCLGARLSKVLDGATFVYAHVHRPFETEVATSADGKRAQPLVRLPSLIDNKSYVVFDQGEFKDATLPVDTHMASETPFSRTKDTCTQRFLEYVEVKRNVACYVAEGTPAETSGCPNLAGELQTALREAAVFCTKFDDWKNAHAADWATVRMACDPWPADRWRCTLRELMLRAFEGARLPPQRALGLGTSLLASVHTTPDKR